MYIEKLYDVLCIHIEKLTVSTIYAINYICVQRNLYLTNNIRFRFIKAYNIISFNCKKCIILRIINICNM